MSLLIQYRFNEESVSIGTDSVGSLDMTNTGVTTISETFESISINAAHFDGSSHLNLPSASLPASMTFFLLGKTDGRHFEQHHPL